MTQTPASEKKTSKASAPLDAFALLKADHVEVLKLYKQY